MAEDTSSAATTAADERAIAETAEAVGTAEAVDVEFAKLVDQLLPPDRSPRRRLATGFAVITAAVVLALAWAAGFVVPNPTYMESSSSSTSMVAADAELVAITGLWFRNSSQATLTLTDIELDTPGLTLDRIEWYQDPFDNFTESASDGAVIADGESDGVSVSESEAEFVGTYRDMKLGTELTKPLPALVEPGQSVRVNAYFRVDDCADPTTTWGTVRGRWEYPNRPSWLHRWDSLDDPLWEPGEFWLHQYVTLDGNVLNAAGPLSGACQLLGIDS